MALRSTNQSGGVPERVLIADARKSNDPGNKNKNTKNDPPPKPNPSPSPTPTPSTPVEDVVTFLPPPIGGPEFCPDPNTLILLSNGKQKRAGDLQVGDTLRTQHEDTLEWGDYEVTYVNISQSDKVSLTFDHVDIICSKTHKFYVENKGWTEVNQDCC